MTFTLPVMLGAWMLYLTLGVLIALVPRPWPPANSVRGMAAVAVPLILAAVQTARSFETGYMLAGIICAVMIGALVRKRAGERA